MSKQKIIAAKRVDFSSSNTARPILIAPLYFDEDRWKNVILPIATKEAHCLGWRILVGWNGAQLSLKADGALTDCDYDHALVHDFYKQGKPIVRLPTGGIARKSILPSVLDDAESGGYSAAEHFAGRNFKHVAHEDVDPSRPVYPMLQSFRSRSIELGLECHTFPSQRKIANESSVANKILGWFKAAPKPIGVLSVTDYMAAQLVELLTDSCFRIPEDVAVMGRGNIYSICECVSPSLSSIELDERARVCEALGLLQRLINGESVSAEPIIIPPKGIVVRESTDILATPDGVVAEALQYMWEHMNEDIAVGQIADVVGLSVSQLQRRFKKSLGRSVAQELLRRRLDTAKSFLDSTDLPIADISPRVGFRSTAYLYRAFRKHFGMTPTQYRRAR